MKARLHRLIYDWRAATDSRRSSDDSRALILGGFDPAPHRLNLEADCTEYMIGHRIMNRTHAFWSFRFFSAGIISALVAQSVLSPEIHLLLMVLRGPGTVELATHLCQSIGPGRFL